MIANVATELTRIQAMVRPGGQVTNYSALQVILGEIGRITKQLVELERVSREVQDQGRPCEQDVTGICQELRRWTERQGYYNGTLALWPLAQSNPAVKQRIDTTVVAPLLDGDFRFSPQLLPMLPNGFNLSAQHAPDVVTPYSIANQLQAVNLDVEISWNTVEERVAAAAIAIATAAADIAAPAIRSALVVLGSVAGLYVAYRLITR